MNRRKDNHKTKRTDDLRGELLVLEYRLRKHAVILRDQADWIEQMCKWITHMDEEYFGKRKKVNK